MIGSECRFEFEVDDGTSQTDIDEIAWETAESYIEFDWWEENER